MKKKLSINISKPEIAINLKDNFFSIGSCFSNELSQYMKNNGIDILSNPFGTVYNTFSISNIINKLFSDCFYMNNDILNEEGTFFTSDHSTKYDSLSSDELLKKVNKNLTVAREYIKKTNVFIITFGTSVVYKYKDRIISNCHRLPDKLFKKEILNVNENIKNINETINTIKSNTKNPLIILTLSPVRHTPNNLVENSYSKSILRISINEVIDNKNVFYFPSYEILLDELRNYSYYKKDGVHLKNKAVKYIINKFISNYFSEDIKNYINNFNKIKSILKHKMKNPSSEEYLQLLINTIGKITNLEKIKKTPLTEKLKIKVIIKIIDNFPDNINTIKKILKTISFDDNTIINFFETVIENNFNKIKLLETTNKSLKKYKDKKIYELYLNE